MTETNLTNLKINVMTEAQKDQTTFGANELIMTPDDSQPIIIDDEPIEGSTNAISSGGVYDALLNRYQVETIYDKDSTDPNINWGYTSGFKNISVTGKDFSKYKILRAYFTKNENSNANILEVGIRRDASENIVRSEATQDVDLTATGTNLRSLYITVESNSSIAFNYIAGNSDYYRDENAYCYKIEGVY